jgi:muramoyltetrapeptide carboxypeptidase
MGVFQRCEPADAQPSLSLAETLSERMAQVATPRPTASRLVTCHGRSTLPVGIRARLDTEARTLTLLEPAVA